MTFSTVNWATIQPYLVPAAVIVGAGVIGGIAQYLAAKKLASSSLVKRHVWLSIALDALDVAIVVWFLSLGFHIALQITGASSRVAHLLDQLLLVLVAGSVTLVAARFVRGAVMRLSRGSSQQIASGTLFASVSQVVVFVLGGLVILSSLGIAITPLITALGVGGLAVALALQPPLANLFSGLQLIASHQIRPGDYVWISSGQEGFVEDINWRSVSIRSNANTLIVVPNQVLAQATFVNYRLPDPSIAATVALRVAYGSDLDFVDRLAHEAVERIEDLRDRAHIRDVSVDVDDFADATVNVTVRFFVRDAVDQRTAKDAFLREFYRLLQEHGIGSPVTAPVVAKARSQKAAG